MCIVSEDTYGYAFFNELLKGLKERYNINDLALHNLGRSYNTYRGSHYDKLNKITKALCASNDCDIIIVTKDADGSNINDVSGEIMHYIPNDFNKVKVLVFDYEIEDWIVYNILGRLSPKPSKYLMEHFQYDKSQLPKYAKDILNNIKSLCELESFRTFLRYLCIENIVCRQVK
ncbi:MAG: hypothetical protein OWQ50_10255 [Acidianus infernus]|nr:hypothetical protein [Acidianus infernus]